MDGSVSGLQKLNISCSRGKNDDWVGWDSNPEPTPKAYVFSAFKTDTTGIRDAGWIADE